MKYQIYCQLASIIFCFVSKQNAFYLLKLLGSFEIAIADDVLMNEINSDRPTVAT